MKTEQATRYDFDDRSRVTIGRTGITAQLIDESVTLNTLDERDLLSAVCNYIENIRYRGDYEVDEYFGPIDRAVAKVRDYIEQEKHKANA